jgi:2-polyprenyl-3-methyl-5-hydroxy-6-metoxy-1,4-benzoquinol methylase
MEIQNELFKTKVLLKNYYSLISNFNFTKKLMEDKANEDFWTNHWKDLPVPVEFSPSNTSVANFPNLEYHRVFTHIFRGTDLSDKYILEIGCANSIFLPYFKKFFGLNIYGLDYSEYGCIREEELLSKFKVEGKIIHGNLFDPPQDLIGKFDFVFSNGVVEHFSDTTNILKSMSVFLKENGKLITAIPSMKDINGQLIKLLNRQLYDIHVPLSAKELEIAAVSAGYQEVSSELVITPSLYVSLNDVKTKVRFRFLKRILNKVFILISRFSWWLQMVLNFRISNSFLTNMIINIATKKTQNN